MTLPLDITKPLQTRAGRPARFLCMDPLKSWPIIALIMRQDGSEFLDRCTLNGGSETDGGRDLVNIPEKRTLDFWTNIYPQPNSSAMYPSKADADRSAGPDRIDCVHVTYEYVVGEGGEMTTTQNQGNTMPLPLDTTKPLQTRAGRPVRFLCMDPLSEWPIVALIMRRDGTEYLVKCALNGKVGLNAVQDLVNVPEKRVLDVWTNIYPQPRPTSLFASKAAADSAAGPTRTECVHIVHEYVVGEGRT